MNYRSAGQDRKDRRPEGKSAPSAARLRGCEQPFALIPGDPLKGSNKLSDAEPGGANVKQRLAEEVLPLLRSWNDGPRGPAARLCFRNTLLVMSAPNQ